MVQPSSHSALSHYPRPLVSLRKLRRETNRLQSAHYPWPQQLPPAVHPEGAQEKKEPVLAPDSWGAYQRNDFSESRFVLLLCGKVLNPLTWDVCVFFLPLFLKLLLEYSCFTMLCWFWLYSKKNHPYVYIYPLFFGFPSHLGHHKGLSGVPCTIQPVLISYVFYT